MQCIGIKSWRLQTMEILEHYTPNMIRFADQT